MGVRFGTLSTKVAQNALPANATETVIYIVGPMILATDSVAVLFHWFITLVVGTGTTVIAVRMRRGTTTAGGLIGASNWSQTVAAGQTICMAGVYFDVFFASVTSYCLTVTQTGASGAGTVEDGTLAAFIL